MIIDEVSKITIKVYSRRPKKAKSYYIVYILTLINAYINYVKLMNMEETITPDNEAILAESRLMNDVTNSFYEYMKNPHAHLSTFAVLVKECIQSVMPWKTFMRYK